jgi:hypothetical protein
MNKKNNSSICIITKEPNREVLDFYNNIKSYDVFIVIDNNNKKYENIISKYKNINFIKMDNKYVENKNYINSSSIYMGFNKVIGWDKALLFFYELRKHTKTPEDNYEFVWFLENDVWFYDENTLLNIDKNYPESDLLTNKYGEKGDRDSWPWNKTQLHEDYEYYKSMVCGCRFSQKMLKGINDYVLEHKTLFFIEIMFATIAKRNNLIYDCPLELRKLSYNDVFKYSDFNKSHLFHPIKDMIKHNIIRKYIDEDENKDLYTDYIKRDNNIIMNIKPNKDSNKNKIHMSLDLR